MASSDPIATDIIDNDTELKGAAKFEGWLLGTPDPDPTSFKLYTSPTFLEWIEIKGDDVLGQIQGGLSRPAGGSTVWVQRGARVVRCQAGPAEYFDDVTAGASSEDPAATRYPPRP